MIVGSLTEVTVFGLKLVTVGVACWVLTEAATEEVIEGATLIVDSLTEMSPWEGTTFLDMGAGIPFIVRTGVCKDSKVCLGRRCDVISEEDSGTVDPAWELSGAFSLDVS